MTTEKTAENWICEVGALAASVGLALLVSSLGGFVVSPAVESWYQEITRPIFSPPDWVFTPVWITLYVLMAVAAWRVWRQGDFKTAPLPLLTYGLQLTLNLAWPFIFFGNKAFGWAFIEIIILWIAIVATTRLFWAVDRPAGALLIPYLAWVSFAVLLNGAIWWLN